MRCRALEPELKNMKEDVAKVIGSIELVFPESPEMFDDLQMQSIKHYRDTALPHKVDMQQ
jgi:DNA/RNA-binding domain of Phe-tRNA-synthetase-like protein